VETLQHRRTNQQNRYYFGVIVSFFREVWSAERRRPNHLPDYTQEETHEVLVGHILGHEDGPLGEQVRKKTRNLSRKDFGELTDKGRELAWHLYKARLPEPGEGKDGL
jgi:hypothetical protein